MSYANFDCSREIMRVLAKPGDSLIRSHLYSALKYNGKNETNFGASLEELVSAGYIVRVAIKLQPTRYERTAKPYTPNQPKPKAPVERTHRRAPSGAPELNERGKGVQAKVTARRQRLLDLLATKDEPLRAKELDALLDDYSLGLIRSDLQVLRNKGLVKSRVDKGPNIDSSIEAVWMLASRPWPAEAHAAAPASAPSATPAQGAADLAEHKQIEERLELALRHAKDARNTYIDGCVDPKILSGMDATVKATEEALQIHRQRRPA